MANAQPKFLVKLFAGLNNDNKELNRPLLARVVNNKPIRITQKALTKSFISGKKICSDIFIGSVVIKANRTISCLGFIKITALQISTTIPQFI